MIDINVYRKILIIYEFSSEKIGKKLFNNFRTYLNNEYIFNENANYDAIELLNNDKTLCMISSLDYIQMSHIVLRKQDLVLKIESNKIVKCKDRYKLNVNNIFNMIRIYKLNKIIDDNR